MPGVDDIQSGGATHIANYGGYGGVLGIEELILSGRVSDAADKVLEQVCNSSDSIKTDMSTGFQNMMLNNCEQTGELQNAIRDMSLSVSGDVLSQSNRIQDNLQFGFSDLAWQNRDEFHELREAQAADYRCLKEGQTLNALETLRNRYELDKEIQKSRKDTKEAKWSIKKQVQKNNDSTKLEIIKSRAKLQAQLDQCCCEIKQQITADGDETRELINANTVDQLKIQLSAAIGEISALKARATNNNLPKAVQYCPNP